MLCVAQAWIKEEEEKMQAEQAELDAGIAELEEGPPPPPMPHAVQLLMPRGCRGARGITCALTRLVCWPH